MTLTKPYILITGGAGFIGANLADRLAGEGRDVMVFDALSRPGVERNLSWLKSRHPRHISSMIADIRDPDAVERAVAGASVAFHFAAQVAVTSSLVDPVEDLAVNVQGTVNMLEALRRRGSRTPMIFASTNKVYGNLADIPLTLTGSGYRPEDPALGNCGVDERRPLQFHTPYGCSKGAADQYVLDYAHSFGLPTCVLRMSCIYGPRQMGSEDQGWVAHFLIRALAGVPISIYGDGHQVRDILYVSDTVDAYIGAWRNIAAVKGRAFNLGGGPANAVSLRSLLAHIERLLGHKIAIKYEDWRPGDQRYYVSDPGAVQTGLSIGAPKVDWRTGVGRLAAWLRQEMGASGEAAVIAAAS